MHIINSVRKLNFLIHFNRVQKLFPSSTSSWSSCTFLSSKVKSAHLLVSFKLLTSWGVSFIFVNSYGKCLVQYSLSSWGLYGAGCFFSYMAFQFMHSNHGWAIMSYASFGPDPNLVNGFLSRSFSQMCLAFSLKNGKSSLGSLYLIFLNSFSLFLL